MTQKEQIDQLNADLLKANAERDGFKADLETLSGTAAADAAALVKVRGDLESEVKAHAATKVSLSAVETERDTLKASDASAGTKAAENLAKNGIAPAAKAPAGKLDADAGAPSALWETYAKADASTQAAMRAEHGAKLEASAEAFDKLQAKA